MEHDDELLKRIADLLVAAGYPRARISSLDKLIGGLAFCITASDADIDYDPFYNNDATLDHKIKGCKAIERALQKMECPHSLQAHQIQDLDYGAVYPVVQWLVEHVLVNCGMLPNQVFSHAAGNGSKDPGTGSNAREDRVWVCSEELEAHPPLISWDAQAGQQEKVMALLRRIAEEEKCNLMLQEQRKDALAQLCMLREMRGILEEKKSQLCLEMKPLEEKMEQAGMAEPLQNIMKKHKIREEGFELQVHSEKEAGPESQQDMAEGSKDHKAEIEDILHQDRLKLKLLKEEMVKKNSELMCYRRQLDEIPSSTELMQYERGFVQLYLQMQVKLQETRRYYANYNALAEANELTEKEISLLNSISVQFQGLVMSQAARMKFVASMSDIAKGVHQKVEKLELRLLHDQRVLSGLKETHARLATDRRQHVNLMKSLQEECAKNEALQNLERQRVASTVAIK